MSTTPISKREINWPAEQDRFCDEVMSKDCSLIPCQDCTFSSNNTEEFKVFFKDYMETALK